MIIRKLESRPLPDLGNRGVLVRQLVCRSAKVCSRDSLLASSVAGTGESGVGMSADCSYPTPPGCYMWIVGAGVKNATSYDE